MYKINFNNLYFIKETFSQITNNISKENTSKENTFKENMHNNPLEHFFFKKLRNNKYFNDILNYKEKNILNLILETCIKHLNKQKIDYFFGFGSLIGTVRHGFRMPWDDDIDLIINRKDIFKLINNLIPIDKQDKHTKYKLTDDIVIMYKNWGVPIKLYYKNSRYPFIDIYLYDSDGDYINIEKKQLQHGHIKKFKELKNDIFPLKTGKFENFIVNIPKNYEKILKNQFGDNVLTTCVISWNHKENKKKHISKEIQINHIHSKFLKPEIYD